MERSEQSEKAEVVRFLLWEEGRVMLCLDATLSEVEVPRRFRTDPGLRLILNRQMPQPIEVGETGVATELRFGGIPHFCVIPFAALWGAFNPDTGHGMFWPETMPDSVRENYQLSFTLLPKGIGAGVSQVANPAGADLAGEISPGGSSPFSLVEGRAADRAVREGGKPVGRPRLRVVEGGREEEPSSPPDQAPVEGPEEPPTGGKPRPRLHLVK